VDEFYKNLDLISSHQKLSEKEIVTAADNLIKFIAEEPKVTEKLIDDIETIYENDHEIVKIRAVEVALKLLDFCLYNNQKPFADRILTFLKTRLVVAGENIQTALIIHYSWAHRKFPNAKRIVKAYDDLLFTLNKNQIFKNLFEKINYMQGVPDQQ